MHHLFTMESTHCLLNLIHISVRPALNSIKMKKINFTSPKSTELVATF